MKVNPKSEKGAITLVVLVGMLFLTVFLMSIYIQLSNKAQDSAETTKQIAEQYNNLGEANNIYNNYFANTDIVPIYTKEQLAKIGSGEEILIDGKIYTFSTDAYYILKKDLDLGGIYNSNTDTWSGEQWTPITDEFTGTLDGLGHTITGLYINNSKDNQGLFGTLKGTVKNLEISEGYVKGNDYVGAVAGLNTGTITNCQNKSKIVGANYVGGIAGNLNEGITECYNTGNIIGESNVIGGYFKSMTTGEIVEKIWNDNVLEDNIYFVSGQAIATTPKGFKVSKNISEQTIENGMVIQDAEGNEFVWVPCTTDKSEFNKSAVEYKQEKKYNIGTTEETSKQYEYSNYTDWDDQGGNSTSVEQYGGFYVARYEAGIPSNASFYPDSETLTYDYGSRNTTAYVPVSKKNTPSWNGISQKYAVTVSKKMYNKEDDAVTSSLIDSYAWDTIVNWMESKEEYKGIATNSTKYGNFLDSNINLTNALYAEHIYFFTNTDYKTIATIYKKGNLEIKERNKSGEQTIYEIATGSAESTKVLNIYDMAGNMWEWTTETGYHDEENKTTQYTVRRGGGISSTGITRPLSDRYGRYTISFTYPNIGFRVVLYVK